MAADSIFGNDISGLGARLHPAAVLSGITAAVGEVLPFERVGIAVLSKDRAVFDVLALSDRGGTPRGRYSFSAVNTAGAWVVRHRVPFKGDGPDDIRDHPRTLDSMLRDGFASNLVVPMEMSTGMPGGVMFMLSRRRRAFSTRSIGVCMRVRDIVEPATRAYLAARDLIEGGVNDRTDADGITQPGIAQDLTLAEVARRHIEAVIADCNGVIEGDRGAAKRLGIKPSTLRAKMKRLGATRFPMR